MGNRSTKSSGIGAEKKAAENSYQYLLYTEYHEAYKKPKEEKIERNPIFKFKRKKKSTAHLLESGEIDGSLSRSEREHDGWSRSNNLKKMNKHTLDKSSSLSNCHSLKLDKKSVSVRNKNSTMVKASKSP